MKSRDSTLVVLLLAIGAVLYMFTPSIGLITPDTVVTFAALAVLLVRPKSLPGLAIGVVAGLLGMAFSKSSIAWFNIPAHAIGALVTAVVAVRLGELMTGPVAWKPAVGALAYGVVSGGLFITAMLILGIFPFQVYITAGWVQVFLSTFSSIIICMVLYRPVKSVYERTG
ncbi:MAG: hypothetical protein E3J21_14305 [Anaerolineales bacterium]|nr:MAG: hypothetical protein E3J21_14305 [Anaerolineales bacterium]